MVFMFFFKARIRNLLSEEVHDSVQVAVAVQFTHVVAH